jgi:CheY-like chemotaxis protein
MIVILTQDLMMTSSVSAVARNKALEFKSAANPERAVKLIGEHSVSVLLIDLQLSNLDLQQLMDQLAATGRPRPRMIAYAQHVNVNLLSAARQVGIEEVLTRGQLHGNLETLLGSINQ